MKITKIREGLAMLVVLPFFVFAIYMVSVYGNMFVGLLISLFFLFLFMSAIKIVGRLIS